MKGWRRFVFKQPQKPALELVADELEPAAGAERHVSPYSGGRTAENPYLAARRAWNEHEGAVIASRQAWQLVGVLSLLIALAAVGGLTYIGGQTRFVPYVVEVDKLGEALAVAPAQRAGPVDQRVIHASVAQFIADARLVTPDVALQRKAVFRVYAMLSPKDAGMQKMTEWLNGSEEASPFKRAAKEMVSTDIVSVIPQTAETWQVEWLETTRDRQGVAKGSPVRMRALVTVYTVPPTPQTTEEQIRQNPLGIYVRDFSWGQQK